MATTPQPPKADLKDALTYVSTSLSSFFKPLPPPQSAPFLHQKMRSFSRYFDQFTAFFGVNP